MDNIFDLNISNIEELTISENDDQNNCIIHQLSDRARIYSSFILSSQNLVETRCEVSFYRSNTISQYIPRLVFKKVLKSNNEVRESSIKDKVIIDIGTEKLGNTSFWKLVSFLKKFKDLIDTGSFEDSLKLVHKDSYVVTEQNLREFLKTPEAPNILNELLQTKLVHSDIINIGYRKQELEVFRKLLFEDYLDGYKETHSMIESKEEVVWQKFFEKNSWIFGYALDYKFQGVLQREFYASSTDTDGSESVIGDFLLGDNNFTTFVELKLPKTPLFKTLKNRSNSWKLSPDVVYATSQILEQKASGQIKLHNEEQFDNNGNKIRQKPYDSKVVLIIGNWNQIDSDSEKIQEIKKKTFQLFRRDSRNIEYLTYDELYERAKFITEGNVNQVRA